MKNKRTWVWIALALAMVAGVGWLAQPAAIPVETITIARGSFERTVDEQAKTRAREPYTVSTPLAGTLNRIALREGDVVSKGQVVAALRPAEPALLDARTRTELEARLEATRAARERAAAAAAAAEVALAQATADLQRTEQLAREKLVAQSRLDTDRLTLSLRQKEHDAARAAAHVATHDVDVARAALSQALGRGAAEAAPWTVLSPVDGRVVRVLQKSEATLPAGTPLLEIADPQDLEVIAELLTSEAAQLVPGAPVTLTNWGGANSLRGSLRRIEPRAFTKISALGVEEQRVNAIIDIASPREERSNLGEGFRIDVRIQVYRAENVLRVPTSALFRSADQWSVFVIEPRGRARIRNVTLGSRGTADAELKSGLAQGERVIIYPGDAVLDGARVIETRRDAGARGTRR
jgi:HlyD family secretion protein